MNKYLVIDRYDALSKVLERKRGYTLGRVLMLFGFLFFIALFLPWTQNIRAKGYVIGLKPEQRPQDIQTVIGGKIKKWFVQEGALVQEGDTLLFITEVNSEYFDPQLVERTQQQVDAKTGSVNAYQDKVRALDNQMGVLSNLKSLKLQQAKIKIDQLYLQLTSDSAALEAEKINKQVAEAQWKRIQEMFDEGLTSLTDLEKRKLKFQEVVAKVVGKENKYNKTKNELINAKVDLNTIKTEFDEKLNKVRSDRSSAISDKYDASASTAKLENTLTNYDERKNFYYITASQSGYVTKVLRSGVGEIVKGGDVIMTIMPEKYDLAVETYVRPIDLPLIKSGQEVRIQFDGWPAIVFSGWPNTSFGTFSGQVIAIDNYISENGKYRIIVAPREGDKKIWPKELRVGSGANTITLLNDVQIWYELWRQLNGFPPDYYDELEKNQAVKSKAPLRRIK